MKSSSINKKKVNKENLTTASTKLDNGMVTSSKSMKIVNKDFNTIENTTNQTEKFQPKGRKKNQEPKRLEKIELVSHNNAVEKESEQKKKEKVDFDMRSKPISRIKSQMYSKDFCISMIPFQRLVRNIAINLSNESIRFTPTALRALHIATEDYMVSYFEDSYLCAMHAKRVTLFKQDLLLTRRIRNNNK